MFLVKYFLITSFSFLIALSSQAEIYKWKDSEGKMRYTDTPPPSNIKLESITGKRTIKSTANAPVAGVAPSDQANTATAVKATTDAVSRKPTAKTDAAPEQDAPDIAARARQKSAEEDKKNKQLADANTKIKMDNCKSARANFET